jgi:hypothetical protein
MIGRRRAGTERAQVERVERELSALRANVVRRVGMLERELGIVTRALMAAGPGGAIEEERRMDELRETAAASAAGRTDEGTL